MLESWSGATISSCLAALGGVFILLAVIQWVRSYKPSWVGTFTPDRPQRARSWSANRSRSGPQGSWITPTMKHCVFVKPEWDQVAGTVKETLLTTNATDPKHVRRLISEITRQNEALTHQRQRVKLQIAQCPREAASLLSTFKPGAQDLTLIPWPKYGLSCVVNTVLSSMTKAFLSEFNYELVLHRALGGSQDIHLWRQIYLSPAVHTLIDWSALAEYHNLPIPIVSRAKKKWKLLARLARELHYGFCVTRACAPDILVLVCNPVTTTGDFSNGAPELQNGTVQWGDGCSISRLNGVDVPLWLAETDPEEIDPRRLTVLDNVEVRREFIRKVGIERCLDVLEHHTLDKSGSYELLALKTNTGEISRRIPRGAHPNTPDHRRCYLKMKNPSIGVWHMEAVHPDCGTVQEALNYRRFGTPDVPKDWTPEKLT